MPEIYLQAFFAAFFVIAVIAFVVIGFFLSQQAFLVVLPMCNSSFSRILSKCLAYAKAFALDPPLNLTTKPALFPAHKQVKKDGLIGNYILEPSQILNVLAGLPIEFKRPCFSDLEFLRNLTKAESVSPKDKY